MIKSYRCAKRIQIEICASSLSDDLSFADLSVVLLIDSSFAKTETDAYITTKRQSNKEGFMA